MPPRTTEDARDLLDSFGICHFQKVYLIDEVHVAPNCDAEEWSTLGSVTVCHVTAGERRWMSVPALVTSAAICWRTAWRMP